MRPILACLFLLLLGAQADTPVMRLTIYDDGLSCPGNCDSHVVANGGDNGTRFVSDPASPRTAPRRCVAGRPCRICFAASDASCMTALYRGAGPPAGKIDATPAFYAEHCGRPGIPAALAAQCASLDRAVTRLGYDRRANCLAGAADPRCAPILSQARSAAAADAPQLAECRRLGETAYNRTRPERLQRSNACLYTKARLGGPNANGVRWRKLLPAACRPGTFVGRDGLDCCSADARFAASVHGECAAYFPTP